MAIFHPKSRIIECKLVYYGPGRGGKTTNLETIFRTGQKYTTGKMVSIDTKGDRTLFFDFLPMGLGKIKGCDIKLQLYTVPGQARYSSTRKLVLKGVDGLVFVADSLRIRRQENMISLKDLQQNLIEQNLDIFKIPLVLQYNKRDLAREDIPIMSIPEMDKSLNSRLNVPSFPGSALYGKGVGAALNQCIKLTLNHLNKKLGWTS